MKIETIATKKLVPYARNARTHSEAQVAQIAASIREFGFTNPVLIDQENGIIAGHGRVLAAQMLERKDVPCIRLSHLNEAQKRAYIIADNKIALNAGWNLELLQLEVNEIDASLMALSGFSEDELQEIVAWPRMPDAEPQQEPARTSEVLVEIRCTRAAFSKFESQIADIAKHDDVQVDIS